MAVCILLFYQPGKTGCMERDPVNREVKNEIPFPQENGLFAILSGELLIVQIGLGLCLPYNL